MTINKNLTIEYIVNLDICNGCGTCYSICQRDAISLSLNNKETCTIAIIDKKKCIDCGECAKYCPTITSLLNQNDHNLFGEFLETYYGYSLDDTLRHHAASGGIVTAILIYLFESKSIDGVIIPIPSKDSPFLYEPYIAKDKQELIENSGTRYFPIPINKIVRELLDSDGKYVLIGTPCILEGLIGLEKKFPKLKGIIVLKIGFFCGGTPNLNAYKYLTYRKHISCDGLKSIFRGIGWPGNNVFYYSDDHMQLLPKQPKNFLDKIDNTLSFFPIFSLKRCLICSDRFSYFSDISVGDAWLNRFSNDTRGTSLIIARTTKGKAILSEMVEKKHILINKISSLEVINSQSIFSEYYKNRNLSLKTILPINSFLKLGKNDLIDTRNYNFWFLKISLLDLGRKIAEDKSTWNFLFLYGLLFMYLWRYISLLERIYIKLLRIINLLNRNN